MLVQYRLRADFVLVPDQLRAGSVSVLYQLRAGRTVTVNVSLSGREGLDVRYLKQMLLSLLVWTTQG